MSAVEQNLAEVVDSEDTIQLALENFAALLENADFTPELEVMGIGRLNFVRRRQMLVEWRGLYIALWRLALGRSFPDDADAMFEEFLQTWTISHPDQLTAKAVERGREYWGMIEVRGDSDFSYVAKHLCSFFMQDEKKQKAMALGLILHIRKYYKLIFDRLI